MKLLGFYQRDARPGAVTGLSDYLDTSRGESDLARLCAGAAVVAPAANAAGEVLVAFIGEPRLSATADAVAGCDDIRAAYLDAGDAFIDRMVGPFALAILDEKARRVVLAIDRMGVERMAWTTSGNGISFSTSASLLARAPGVSTRLDDQKLFEYFLFHMVPSPSCVFEGIHKLPPATCLVFEEGEARLREYWRPTFDEPAVFRFDTARDEMHAIIERAVRETRPSSRSGAFLSGGLDSSTVAGYLGRVLDTPAKTFSIGFGVDSFDELDFARTSNTHFGCISHEYNVTPDDIVSAFPEIASAYDEPFGNSSVVPTIYCARLARKHGVTHLLAGDGGDELFGGNERYAKQKVFEAYRHVPAPVRRLLLEPLSRWIDRDSRIVPLRKLRSYVEQASIPLPERLETWNYVYREGLQTMFSPDFIGRVDLAAPMRHMHEVFHASAATTTLDRQLVYDWRFTLADNDLRKVTTMCRAAGVEVAFPLLHHDLVEFSTRVPATWKLRGLQLRTFYKKSMAGFLPDKILRKQKHGFGLPFGLWLKSEKPLAELIYGNLETLKSRRILRDGFIDELLAQQREGHASYYGYVIWDLAMLAEWLRRHGL